MNPAGRLPWIERQLTLERLGWQFIRLRASEFFRDPEAGMKKLFKRLKDLGIEAGPTVPGDVDGVVNVTDLLAVLGAWVHALHLPRHAQPM